MIKQTTALLLPFALLASPLSPDAQALLKEQSISGFSDHAVSRSATSSISGMIFVDPSFDESAFLAMGGEIFSRSPEVMTVTIPFGSLSKLQSIHGLKQFSPARKVKAEMDSALVAGHAKSVYVGIGEPSKKYTGKGVIVGVIDAGIDFVHPAFRTKDSKGNDSLRVSRVWDQKSSKGSSPVGYRYGSAYTTPDQIKKIGVDANNSTYHGTHVAGIAAGSYSDPSKGIGHGVATESELVLVSTTMYDNGIVDGVKWIFDYADSVHKPAVINLSLGSHDGPHDGTSAIDRIFEAYTGKGKIIVGAAGNERSQNHHVLVDLKTKNDTVRTSISIPAEYDDEPAFQRLSIWGEISQDFSIGMELYSSSGKFLKKTPLYSVSQIATAGGVAVSPDGKINCEYYAELNAPSNGKSNIWMFIESPKSLIEGDSVQPVLVFTGSAGKIHAWGAGENSYLAPSFYSGVSGTISGDSLYTVGEIGGTGRAVISVGAVHSKKQYMNNHFKWISSATSTLRPVGGMAYFSSIGPTVDGRVKPDISAPGDVIVSSIRRGIFADTASSSPVSAVVEDGFGKFPYGGESGTSMASPFVTGAVALMLQANPNLTSLEIKKLLQKSAMTDSYTGQISSEGSNQWGAGKINVDSAVVLAIQSAGGSGKSAQFALEPRAIFSSIGNGSMNLSLSGVAGNAELKLYDFRGRELFRKSIPEEFAGKLPQAISGLAAGSYIYQISGSTVQLTGKVIVSK